MNKSYCKYRYDFNLTIFYITLNIIKDNKYDVQKNKDF